MEEVVLDRKIKTPVGQGPILLETKKLTKQFPMVVANDAVDFEVREREIHCLLGENGAGKSTLAESLFGFYSPDAGEIIWKGENVDISSPAVAMDLGIGMVHQHFMLVETHSVLENILLGRDTPGVLLDEKAARARITELCEQYNVNMDPDSLIWQLSVGEQQWVEILKALYDGVKLLILDEPTAVLTPRESERLFAILKKMSLDGLAIIFITHKLNEVVQVSDRVTVLRRGKKVDTVNSEEVTKAGLARMMVGRDVVFRVHRDEIERGDPVLQMYNVQACNDIGLKCVHNVDLSLHKREILGVAGVAGNGQKELFEVLIGMRELEGGKVQLDSEDISGKSVGDIQSSGVAHVPGDRIKEGLVMDFTIAENMILGHEWSSPFRKGIQLNDEAIRSFADEGLESYEIAAPSVDHVTGNLSGGNLQKVVLAREIGSNPKVLIANQPTRGLDVGVIEYVHSQFLQLRSDGVGLLLFSEDLDEIMTLSDRIAVIFQGEILRVFDASEAHVDQIGLLMAGVKEGS
jgi:simple sugar transport system ATP-binding protein|tara:strand:- start:4536 stop:6095 length:1560 start_codon:yes stop_codon:yes gene_type:complete